MSDNENNFSQMDIEDEEETLEVPEAIIHHELHAFIQWLDLKKEIVHDYLLEMRDVGVTTPRTLTRSDAEIGPWEDSQNNQ